MRPHAIEGLWRDVFMEWFPSNPYRSRPGHLSLDRTEADVTCLGRHRRSPLTGVDGFVEAGISRRSLPDDGSVTAAAADVAEHEGSIDVLINNAGIHGPAGDSSTLTGTDALGVFDVNLAGAVRTTTAFLPLLRRSSDPVIVNVSSGMGSLAITHDPSRFESSAIAPLYSASKAALTMLTTQYAKALPDIRINAADPGYTATNLNGHSGPQTVTEGTDAIVGLATERPGAGSGRFVDRTGEIAW
ncbi:SDR family NAD(P)-dependent oxidoreductase [Streptomyces sp. NBC_01318]|uniref:SDR family NAD(P)-dependent oxidoreductase n=1 Tax=Streptomyces sp. NBC_01318 TaxID=2903823 RepID=UPI002E136D06|nr:SDR family NAD(P)-dependent oxidoreductase [Streptomyces sp. NBC_01318]WSJ55742.1 SDR family NAD(P)-dependent oxidoreductase [Streptomyces sp. NBC_01318]